MKKDNTIYQISLLQALVNGYYDGIKSAKELKELGDVGIGTFAGTDGEMIYINGKIYKALVDGSVVEPTDEELIPFGVVTKFTTTDKINLTVEDVKKLKTTLNRYRDMNCKSMFIAIRITGLFKRISVRSIPKQNKPFNNFVQLVEKEQKIYEYKNVKGTIIGFLFPRFMRDINTTDLHMHFVSDDHSMGGHVLEVEFEKLNLETSVKSGFDLIIPNTDKFNNLKLSVSAEDLKKVEE